MGCFDRVLLWVFKSIESLESCRLALNLFPQATFFVVMSVPKPRARFFMTSLYRELASAISNEVFESVGNELRAHGVRIGGFEKVLGGPAEIESLAKRLGTEVVSTSISLELGPDEMDLHPVAKFVSSFHGVSIVYTPLSRTPGRPTRIALAVGRYELSKSFLKLLSHIANLFEPRVDLYLLEEGSVPRELRNHGISEATYIHSVARDLVEALENVSRDHDLLIVDSRSVVPPKPRTRIPKLSIYERIALSISRAPTAFCR